jgi:acyl carrier protein
MKHNLPVKNRRKKMITEQLLNKVQETYMGKSKVIINQNDKNLIKWELRDIIAEELDCQTEAITDSDFFLDLGLDSISTLEIFDEIKKRLQIAIPTGQIMSFARDTNAEIMDLSIEVTSDLIIDFIRKQGKIT